MLLRGRDGLVTGNPVLPNRRNAVWMLHLPNSFVLNEGSLAFAFTSQAQDQLRQLLPSHCVVCVRTDPKFTARPRRLHRNTNALVASCNRLRTYLGLRAKSMGWVCYNIRSRTGARTMVWFREEIRSLTQASSAARALNRSRSGSRSPWATAAITRKARTLRRPVESLPEKSDSRFVASSQAPSQTRPIMATVSGSNELGANCMSALR
jgi:hypothetical protein